MASENGKKSTKQALADARRNVHEELIHLTAWEADRVRDLLTELEEAVRQDERSLKSPTGVEGLHD